MRDWLGCSFDRDPLLVATVKNLAKASDLEDWGGLAVASCYCDIVVCEKHMASMLRRNGFSTKARIETALDAALPAA